MSSRIGFCEAHTTSRCRGDRVKVLLRGLVVSLWQDDSHRDCDCGCDVKERSKVKLMKGTINHLQQYIEDHYQSDRREVPVPFMKAQVTQSWSDSFGNNGGDSYSPETNHTRPHSSQFGRRKSRNLQHNHLMPRENRSRSGSETLFYDNHGSNYCTERTGLEPDKFLEPSVPLAMHNMTDGDVPPPDIDSLKAVENDKVALCRDINKKFDTTFSQQSSFFEGLEKDLPQQNNAYADKTECSLLPANSSQSPQFSLHMDIDATSTLAQNASSSRLQEIHGAIESHGAIAAESDQNKATNKGVVANTVVPASLTLSDTLPERSSRSTTPKDPSTSIPANTEMPQLSSEYQRTKAIPLSISRQSPVDENTTIADKEPTLTSSNVLQPLDPSSLVDQEDHHASTRSSTPPTAPVHSKDQLAHLKMEWRIMLKRKRDGGSWHELAEYYKDLLGKSITTGALRMRYRTLCQKEPWLRDYVGESSAGRKRDASSIERLDRTSRKRRVMPRALQDKEDKKITHSSRLRRRRSTIPSATCTNEGTEEAFEEWYAQGSSEYHMIIENNSADSDEYHPESEDDNDVDDAPTSKHRRLPKHSIKSNASIPSQPILPDASELNITARLDPLNASGQVAASLATSNWQNELNKLPQDLQYVAKKRRDRVRWDEIMENYNLLTRKKTTINAMRIKFTNLKKEETWLSDYLSGRERTQPNTRNRHGFPSVESQQDDYDDDDGEV